MNYEIILKFSYTVEDVNSEEEAYEEAIKIMKQDTHPMPYDWASYRLSSDEEEDQGASPSASALCTKIRNKICAILLLDFF